MHGTHQIQEGRREACCANCTEDVDVDVARTLEPCRLPLPSPATGRQYISGEMGCEGGRLEEVGFTTVLFTSVLGLPLQFQE